MNRSLLCFVLIFSIAGVRADDAVRATQEELRRRNIYFGDIDGRNSKELEEALKRYQRRKGLTSTGNDDHDTLRSLGVITRGPNEPVAKELELPDEPVLKSDTKIDIAAEAHEIAADTGVSAASVAPDAIASGKDGGARQAAAAKHRSEAGNDRVPGSGNSKVFAGKNARLPGAVQDYVNRYLNAVGHNELPDELHFYADRVNYLGNGWVDRRIIEHSLKKYYARWPHRSYSRPEDVRYQAIPSRGEIVVAFRTEFMIRNGKVKARGKTDNEIIINAATTDPRIISIQETRVR